MVLCGGIGKEDFLEGVLGCPCQKDHKRYLLQPPH